MAQIAVVFPGIGYHPDKPLLYHAKKIAAMHGYEIKEVPYGGFDTGIKGDQEKMKQAFLSALEQAGKLLADVDWEKYDRILFISKSIGTAVAAAYAAKMRLRTDNLFFTPVEASFQFMKDPGIVFYGSGDPWLAKDVFQKCMANTEYEAVVVEGGNHSLETKDALEDVRQLLRIMDRVELYIEKMEERS